MKNTRNRLPLIAVMANSGFEAGLPTQTVDDKYCRAVSEAVGANCIVVPTSASADALEDLVQIVDGILLTGDTTNVEPHHYGGVGNLQSHGPFDPQRDRSVLQLIKLAHKKDVPMLGICRGMQEMNVALGGTLRNDLYGNLSFADHCVRPQDGPPETRYAPSHIVELVQDGRLREHLGLVRAEVNSLHKQAVDILADSLRSEAISQDGLVEAFCDPDRNFFYGVQWHAEFSALSDQVSQALFAMFSQSVHVYSGKLIPL
ncbi:gamma-glutamyl-gamma-aminobutyrate hydrolase family protein [Maritalea porphyrae]|nr:gamma-glutamyl-gamma-aminobutyrate hydrolase family protein [Maritalea porphyrae]MCZ4271266.1 gamma-glutamyl-gamma-aminobutyrate hydrolase family protein [Maritalea porphyrae]